MIDKRAMPRYRIASTIVFAEPMEQTMPDPTVQTPQEADLARLIVKTLNLELAPDAIDPNAPLFADGLGLDSIDILELALAISQTYGVRLRSDDENNATIFQSLRSLSHDIQQRRPG
jgi:acyl carrier protein